MSHEDTRSRASELLWLHRAETLLELVNVWDGSVPRSSRTFWHHSPGHGEPLDSGVPRLRDGENTPLELMLEAVGRIVTSTSLRVTADLEGGYGNAA
jgi:2-methylisocitrate lyase-like PEP mutase family enzyme